MNNRTLSPESGAVASDVQSGRSMLRRFRNASLSTFIMFGVVIMHILPILVVVAAVTAFARNKSALQPVDFMTLQSTPASSRIVDKDSMCIGWFNAPFSNTNIKTGRCSHPLREKQWQYISFTSADHIIGMSTINVGYLSSFFLYCFDMRTGQLVEFDDLGLGGGKSRVAANSLTGTSIYKSKRCSISVENNYDDGYYLVRVNCTDKKKNSIAGTVMVHVRGDPMVNIREIAPRRLVYTHQSAAYRPEGSLVCNGDTITLNPDTDFAGFDYTRGRHLYKTAWNWAAAGGYAANGASTGISFADGTGFFYWINGTINRAREIRFDYQHVDSLWRLTSPDSTIVLTFAPLGKRTGKVNVLGLIKSNFYQPFGTFSGTIRPPGREEPVHIDALRGVTEEHEARW